MRNQNVTFTVPGQTMSRGKLCDVISSSAIAPSAYVPQSLANISTV